MENKNTGFSFRVWIAICFAALMAYMLPILMCFWQRPYFSYVNAWDEETYLSYQGAWAMHSRPGYFILRFIAMLHDWGISGAWQNFLFDLTVPLITMLFIYFVFRIRPFSLSPTAALAGSFITTWGDLLWKASNPIWSFLLPASSGAVANKSIQWTLGLDSFAGILRSPNPQLSFLLLAGASFYALKKEKNLWPALLIAPLLYWPLWLIFPFSAMVWLAYKVKPQLFLSPEKKILPQIIVIVFSALISGLVLSVALNILLSQDSAISSTDISKSNASIIISPSIVYFLLLDLLYGFYLRKKISVKNTPFYDFLLIFLSVAVLYISEIHLFLSRPLVPWSLQSFPISLITAFATFLLLMFLGEVFGSRLEKISSLCLGVIILLILLKTQGFEFDRLRFRVFLNSPIAASALERIRQHSTSALIPSASFAGRVGLMFPQVLHPPLAYEYHFPFLWSDCSWHKAMLQTTAQALTQPTSELSSYLDAESQLKLERQLEAYRQAEAAMRGVDISQLNSVYCKSEYFPQKQEDFFLIQLDEANVWGYFP